MRSFRRTTISSCFIRSQADTVAASSLPRGAASRRHRDDEGEARGFHRAGGAAADLRLLRAARHPQARRAAVQSVGNRYLAHRADRADCLVRPRRADPRRNDRTPAGKGDRVGMGTTHLGDHRHFPDGNPRRHAEGRDQLRGQADRRRAGSGRHTAVDPLPLLARALVPGHGACPPPRHQRSVQHRATSALCGRDDHPHRGDDFELVACRHNRRCRHDRRPVQADAERGARPACDLPRIRRLCPVSPDDRARTVRKGRPAAAPAPTSPERRARATASRATALRGAGSAGPTRCSAIGNAIPRDVREPRGR